MLDFAQNPYSEPIRKFLHDLKVTKWKFPFILQIAHGVITIFLLILLLVLYITIGIVSQISNSFWDLITGLGQKMSFSNPIESSFYAFSASIYFILFLPFFIIQSPIWLSGWFSSKIGFRPFIVMLLIIIVTAGLYYFQPQFANEALEKIISLQDSIRLEYFTSDSTITMDANISNIVAD
jgi:hypothetical protein